MICFGFSAKNRDRRLRVAIAKNKDPCFSVTQPREETVKQSHINIYIVDVESPVLLPLFGDALAGKAGEEDDEDEELSPHLLDDDEEEEDDAILLRN